MATAMRTASNGELTPGSSGCLVDSESVACEGADSENGEWFESMAMLLVSEIADCISVLRCLRDYCGGWSGRITFGSAQDFSSGQSPHSIERFFVVGQAFLYTVPAGHGFVKEAHFA